MAEDGGLTSEQANIIALLVRRFHNEVFENAEDIDPDQEMDWSTMAFGFLLGAGIPAEMIDPVWCTLMQAGDAEDLISELGDV